jgi:hypothetical protein
MEASGEPHSSSALLPGKEPHYPLDRWLDGLQSLSRLCGEEKSSQLLPRLEPPIIQPIVQLYTTELCRVPLNTIYLVKIFS